MSFFYFCRVSGQFFSFPIFNKTTFRTKKTSFNYQFHSKAVSCNPYSTFFRRRINSPKPLGWFGTVLRFLRNWIKKFQIECMYCIFFSTEKGRKGPRLQKQKRGLKFLLNFDFLTWAKNLISFLLLFFAVWVVKREKLFWNSKFVLSSYSFIHILIRIEQAFSGM